MPRNYRCIVGLLAALLPLSVLAQPLKMAADYWPPFTDATEPGGGLAVDLVTTALTRAGYTSEYNEVPWVRALKGVELGDYDMLVTCWYDDSRAAYGIYSQPYLVNRVRLIKRKGVEINFKTLADLQPFSIAVTRGYAYSPDFDKDAGLNKVDVRNFISGARMVSIGRVDLTVEDEYVAGYYLAREPDNLARTVEFVDPPLSLTNLYILVSDKNPDRQKIIDDFNRAVAQMKVDGTYAELFRKHGISSQWEVH